MNTDYEFYRSRYNGGSIPDDEWPEYSTRAEAILYRYKRIYTVTVPDYEPEAEKLAVCAMAEALHSFDLIANGEGGPVQSASIGAYLPASAHPALMLWICPRQVRRRNCTAALLCIWTSTGGWADGIHQKALLPGGLQPVQSDCDRLSLERRHGVHPEGVHGSVS